jgi:hypothetical protein
LSTLGIQDGAVFTSTTYRVVAEDLGTVGFIFVNADGAVTGASFRKG